MATLKGTGKNETLTDRSADRESFIYGFGGNDLLYGMANTDNIYGGTGHDTLYGGAGIDYLYGEAGDDWLVGDAGRNTLNGGTGSDGASFINHLSSVRVALDNSFARSANATDIFVSIEKLQGSQYNDLLAGNSVSNDIFGDDGADKIYGRSGDDNLFGENGRDFIYGERGNDWLYSENGGDWVVGAHFGNTLDGGTGTDTASYANIDIDFSAVAALDQSLDAESLDGVDIFVSIENLEGSVIGWDLLAGNSGRNTLWGLGGNDRLFGRGGADSLYGGSGNDNLQGEAGDDYLYGGVGRDQLNGGSGMDQVSYFFTKGVTVALDGSLAATGEASGDTFISIEQVEGSKEGADIISGNALGNTIWSYGGYDRLYGRAGSDELYGGDGRDYLYGENDDDVLHGEKGADVLSGGNGVDEASYYFGTGVTVSLDGSLRATGEAVGDTFYSIENLSGSSTGNDILSGNALDNTIWGNGGNDLLYGRDGDDLLRGFTGDDKIYGGNGADELWGGAGKDYLNGGSGRDYAIYFESTGINLALDGSFARKGAAVGDTLVAIESIAGSDTGADRLAGNASVNELWGDGGNDTLFGRAGNDFLYGGGGADRLSGESGNDTFVFLKSTDGVDVITDFASGDKIEIRTSGFSGLSIGSLSEFQFQSGIGHVAENADVRFILDETNDSVWFDSDGDGAAAAIMFATLSNGYNLSELDFLLTA